MGIYHLKNYTTTPLTHEYSNKSPPSFSKKKKKKSLLHMWVFYQATCRYTSGNPCHELKPFFEQSIWHALPLMCLPIGCLYSTMGGAMMGVFLAQLWEPPIHNHFDSPLRAFSQPCVKLKWKSSSSASIFEQFDHWIRIPLVCDCKNLCFPFAG